MPEWGNGFSGDRPINRQDVLDEEGGEPGRVLANHEGFGLVAFSPWFAHPAAPCRSAAIRCSTGGCE